MSDIPFAAYPPPNASASNITASGDGTTPALLYLSVPLPSRRVNISAFRTSGSLKEIKVYTKPLGAGTLLYTWTPGANPEVKAMTANQLDYEDQQSDPFAAQCHFTIANTGGSAVSVTIQISGRAPRQ